MTNEDRIRILKTSLQAWSKVKETIELEISELEKQTEKCMSEHKELIPDDFIEQNDPIGAKDEHGKLDLTLVPIMPMWKAIARVREYGVQKYKNPENWKGVSKEQFWKAFLRHTGEVIDRGFEAKDYETGLLHLWHMACNLCFIIALMEIERFQKILFGEEK